MPSDFDTAYDEIFGLFKTTWDADTPAVTGGAVPQVFYQGVGEIGPPPPDEPWARISILHNVSDQAALLGDDVSGRRRYTNLGIITVEVYTPIGQGLVLIRQLAPIARKAFQGKHSSPGNIWFRRARINEAGVDGPWNRMTVIVDFEYDEFV